MKSSRLALRLVRYRKMEFRMMTISLIIPVYNEGKRLLTTFEQIDSFMTKELNFNIEIVFVDDGSTDESKNLIKSFVENGPQFKLVTYSPNQGKGFAIKFASKYCTGDLIGFTDCDLSTPLFELKKVFDVYKENPNSVIIGDRKSFKENEHGNFIRRLSSFAFLKLATSILKNKYIDTQAGFKFFPKNVVGQILPYLRINRFSFDVEILFLIELKNIKVIEVPIRWVNSPDSKVQLFKDSLKMFTDLLYILKLNRLRVYQNINSDLPSIKVESY